MKERPKTVREVMSRRVLTLAEDEDIELVESAMERYRFRHLPVVSGDKLVGLVTHRDILRSEVRGTSAVRDIMKTDVTTAAPDMALSDAARLMLMHKADCLPVTDDEERLVGIVTASDFMRLAIELLER
jgi:CBS domain-containing protein